MLVCLFHMPDNEAEACWFKWNSFLFVFGFGIWLCLFGSTRLPSFISHTIFKLIAKNEASFHLMCLEEFFLVRYGLWRSSTEHCHESTLELWCIKSSCILVWKSKVARDCSSISLDFGARSTLELLTSLFYPRQTKVAASRLLFVCFGTSIKSKSWNQMIDAHKLKVGNNQWPGDWERSWCFSISGSSSCRKWQQSWIMTNSFQLMIVNLSLIWSPQRI